MNPLRHFRDDLEPLKEVLRTFKSQASLVVIFATLALVTRRSLRGVDWWIDLCTWVSPLLANRELRFRVEGILLLGVVPVLLVLFVHRRRLVDFGLGLPKLRWFGFATLYLAVVHPINFLYASSPSILEDYPFYAPARDGGIEFWGYQALVAVYMLAWEFLLRGYMLFGMRERLGPFAILVQLLPFVILHFGYSTPELYFCVIDGLFLGAIAYISRSVWPVVFIHTLQSLLWEIEVVYLFQ